MADTTLTNPVVPNPPPAIKPGRVIAPEVMAWANATTPEKKAAAVKQYPQLRAMYAEASELPQ